MTSIGIFCDSNRFQTLDILSRLYKYNGIKPIICGIDEYYKSYNMYNQTTCNDQDKIFVVKIDKNTKYLDLIQEIEFDISVFLDYSYMLCTEAKNGSKNIVIANCDEKNVFPFSVGVGTTLITCGLSNKASVTTSSILQSEITTAIQCCVQRKIETIGHKEILPGEFLFEYPSNYNISCVLTLLTVGLVCGLIDGF